MEKELFRISINLETENREFIESDIKFLHLAQQSSYRKNKQIHPKTYLLNLMVCYNFDAVLRCQDVEDILS